MENLLNTQNIGKHLNPALVEFYRSASSSETSDSDFVPRNKKQGDRTKRKRKQSKDEKEDQKRRRLENPIQKKNSDVTSNNNAETLLSFSAPTNNTPEKDSLYTTTAVDPQQKSPTSPARNLEEESTTSTKSPTSPARISQEESTTSTNNQQESSTNNPQQITPTSPAKIPKEKSTKSNKASSAVQTLKSAKKSTSPSTQETSSKESHEEKKSSSSISKEQTSKKSPQSSNDETIINLSMTISKMKGELEELRKENAKLDSRNQELEDCLFQIGEKIVRARNNKPIILTTKKSQKIFENWKNNKINSYFMASGSNTLANNLLKYVKLEPRDMDVFNYFEKLKASSNTDLDKLLPVAFWYFEVKLGIPFQTISQQKSQPTDFPIPESILELAFKLLVDLFPTQLKSANIYTNKKIMMKKINEAKLHLLDGNTVDQIEKFKNLFINPQQTDEKMEKSNAQKMEKSDQILEKSDAEKMEKSNDQILEKSDQILEKSDAQNSEEIVGTEAQSNEEQFEKKEDTFPKRKFIPSKLKTREQAAEEERLKKGNEEKKNEGSSVVVSDDEENVIELDQDNDNM